MQVLGKVPGTSGKKMNTGISFFLFPERGPGNFANTRLSSHSFANIVCLSDHEYLLSSQGRLECLGRPGADKILGS